MTDEPQAPVFNGRYVTFGGRTMLRAAGGETDAPTETDTPAPDADSQPGTPAQENYEQRYKDLQAEFTRASQENSQLREFVNSFSDPEKAAEALSALGYEIEGDEPEPVEYDNPYEAELAQVKAQLAEQGQKLSEMTQAQQQAAQQAAEQAYFEQQFESLGDEAGRQLSQQEVNHIVAFARANPDNEGRPDVKAGWESLKTLYDANFDATVKAKKNAPKAPSGQPGAAVPDLTTRSGRLHAAMEKMASLEE